MRAARRFFSDGWVLFISRPDPRDERYVRARNVPRLVDRCEEATHFDSERAAEAYLRAAAKLRHLSAIPVEVGR